MTPPPSITSGKEGKVIQIDGAPEAIKKERHLDFVALDALSS
jgi:hypothetical protein